MKRGRLIIALAQIRYFERSKNNVEKIKKFIGLAKRKNADIVCFPESCVHKRDILDFNHKWISEIKEECRKNSIWCIINEDMRIRGKLYNTAILIDRKGKIKGSYQKMNLMGDSEGLMPGVRPKVFTTEFGKIGIAICWDLAFPELFKKMKKKGAQIVFCPSQWAYETKAHKDNHKNRERKILKAVISARAFENLFFVCLCNPVVDLRDHIVYSAIAAPHKIIKELIDKEGLLVSEINLNEIDKFQKMYKEAL